MIPEARRPFPGRQALVFVGLLFLAAGVFGSLALVVPQISPACGCSAAPEHTSSWTLPPVSRAQAGSISARFTGVEMTPLDSWFEMNEHSVFQTVGPNAAAFVDADSGELLLAVKTDALPDGSTGRVSLPGATDAATGYLSSVGISSGSLTARASNLPLFPGVVEVDFFAEEVKLVNRVFVNGVSGSVFAFTSSRLDYSSVPVVSKNEAVRRARQALPEEGDVVLNADLVPGFDGRPAWTWQIGLGIPLESDVYTGGGYVEVNAGTGRTTVMKDARDPSPR